jgi:HSP20 family protein
VSLHGELLTVAFEHNEQNNQQDANQGYLRKEYRMQSFSRSFTLDDTVDANKISATYNDGILQLTLPKKEGAQQLSRTIEIQ